MNFISDWQMLNEKIWKEKTYYNQKLTEWCVNMQVFASEYLRTVHTTYSTPTVHQNISHTHTLTQSLSVTDKPVKQAEIQNIQSHMHKQIYR